jgi:hypothetical protein
VKTYGLLLPLKGRAKDDKADQLAAEYVQKHNAASKEYKAAFAAVGARMWPMDNAHILRPANQQALADSIRRLKGWRPLLPRPLTVLDSYKDVTPKQRKWLNSEVDKIYQKYGGKFGAATDAAKQFKKALKTSVLAKTPYAPGDLILLPSGKRAIVAKVTEAENLFGEKEWHVATKTGEVVVIPCGRGRAKDAQVDEDAAELAHVYKAQGEQAARKLWVEKTKGLNYGQQIILQDKMARLIKQGKATDSAKRQRMHRALDCIMDRSFGK